MQESDWHDLIKALLKFFLEERAEPEHAEDEGEMAFDPPVSEKQRRAMYAAASGHSTLGIPKKVGEEFVGKVSGDSAHGFRIMAGDRAIGPFMTRGLATRAAYLAAGRRPRGLAYDRTTARAYDVDGRMRAVWCHISKACVSPYLGKEIPDYERLGLDAEKIYQLLRDPQELARAAPSFNGLPILDEHIPVSARDPNNDAIVGCTGSDAVFKRPYLDNTLNVWAQDAIDRIKSGDQREISCGYYYVPDMRSGTFEGEHFDGVMREIIGNHVALVEKGRAGSDVVVADAIPEWIVLERALTFA